MKRSSGPGAHGDPAAMFTELYRRNHAAVVAFCARRIADEQEARDAAAETFATAWRRLSDAHDPSLPWLLAIARRTLANRRRAGTRQAALVDRLAADRVPLDATCPSGAVHDRIALREALAALSPSDREVLALWAWDRLSARDAAASLDITPTAYGVRLFRARRRLAKRFAGTAEPRPVVTAGSPTIDARRTHA